MIKDEKAQMSIDFLVGISLFILALVFMAHFIPGMFVPFQTETIDLNSVAYRTSVILVEDPGWGDNGTDWENQSMENISRVGLAINKEHPNMLALRKSDGFRNESLMDNKNLGDKLGLYRKIGDNKVYYGYNITIVSLDEDVLASRGSEIPEYGDVSSMRRIVNAQTDSVYLPETLEGSPPPQNDKALFNVTKTDEDVTVIIGDLIVVDPPNTPKLEQIKITNIPCVLDKDVDYKVWVDNGTGNFELLGTPMWLPPYPYNSSSLMKITIYKHAFIDGINEIEVKFTGIEIIKFGKVNLDELEKTIISEPAILRVNVWS